MKAANIPVTRAVMCDEVSASVEEALNTADKNEGWAVIESLHLASSDVMKQLVHHMERIFKSRGKEDVYFSKTNLFYCCVLIKETEAPLVLMITFIIAHKE